MEEIRISEDPNYVHLFSGGLDSTYGLLKLNAPMESFWEHSNRNWSITVNTPAKGRMQEITEYMRSSITGSVYRQG